MSTNKKDLIDMVAGDTGLTKADSGRALDSVLENIRNSVKKGDDVVLIGFGTFKKTKRSARSGVNPQTGAKIQIKAKNVVKFKAGKKFKDSLN